MVGTFAVTHSFADPGTFTVRFTIADDDGGEGVAIATVTVGTVKDAIEELIDDVRGLIDDGEPAQAASAAQKAAGAIARTNLKSMACPSRWAAVDPPQPSLRMRPR